MTRDEISEQAARLAAAMMLKQLSRSGANEVIEAATDKMVDFYRATLNEAARAVCAHCAAGHPISEGRASWTHHQCGMSCQAEAIHDLIAAMDSE